MKVNLKKEECCGCGACADICHMEAIQMVQDREGFKYPRVNKKICVNCGRCRRVCPLKNIEEKKYQQLYVGLQANNKQVRYSSSSGGAFYVLAQYVLEKGGVVYGAGYFDEMVVKHRMVIDTDQLEQIRRTKYVQSDLQGIFHSVKKQLENKKWVLFCGTPCQVQALNLFLNKYYDSLILVDLVCYGVASPQIWRAYTKYVENVHKGKMTKFSFRDKRNRDNGHTCSYKIDDVEYEECLYNNIYCKMYFGNYILRPSCYECKFCTVNRKSDFTIGDFWGIENVKPDMDDGMGTSLMIVRTDKAKDIWNKIKTEVRWFECEKEDILQPRLCAPTEKKKGRWLFMVLYEFFSFSFIVKLVSDIEKIRKKFVAR